MVKEAVARTGFLLEDVRITLYTFSSVSSTERSVRVLVYRPSRGWELRVQELRFCGNNLVNFQTFRYAHTINSEVWYNFCHLHCNFTVFKSIYKILTVFNSFNKDSITIDDW